MRPLFLPLALAALFAAGPAAAQPAAAQQTAVERGLAPAAQLDGQSQTFTLEERMAHWKVPGVSVAVIDDGRIAWAKGYGTADAATGSPVTPQTRFQAASISKPVAAAAALRLVQEGRLDLTADVNTVLRSWKVPASPFTQGRPITLHDLLSHTGGTTVHGFPGYAQGAPVPTLAQVLSGEPPANTAAVVSERRPGEAWKYSGGGYQIVQMMIEDVTGRPFGEVVRDLVLRPAGMIHSGYDLPHRNVFSRGHAVDGSVIPGGWHTYPEQAAAGLWTTPTDLARFGLALRAALQGESGAMLDQETARLMMTEVMSGYGLGPGLTGEGELLAVSHGGSNEGFRCFWVIHPATGDGVVVMTNGERGNLVGMEIVRAVSNVYGWSGFKPQQLTTQPLSEAVWAARTGVWTTEADGRRIDFTLRRVGDRMVFDTFRGAFTFAPTAPETMVSPDTGAIATFTISEGVPVLRVYGLELKKQP